MPSWNKSLLLLLIGSFLFNYLFWSENLGINLFMFDLFLLACIFMLFPKSLKSSQVLLAVSCTLLSALFVVYHNSDFVKITHYLSLYLTIGFVHQPELRSVLSAAPTSFIGYITIPPRFVRNLKTDKNYSGKLGGIVSIGRIAIIPLLFLLIFFFIFKFANPVFDKLSGSLFDSFLSLFSEISFPRVFFFLFGAFLVSGILFNANVRAFLDQELRFSDLLRRKKAFERKWGEIKWKKLNVGLKTEFWSAVMLMGLVNLLLLIVNVIDVYWVWFNFEYTPGFDLKHFVHEATYLLIVSILLSMGIMLYYFRKNLNFYYRQKWIKTLAYIWIIQNIVLLLSVAIRNFHYIHYFGLAYKRIGVIIFLLLIIIGCYTLFIKIRDKRSGYYLFRMNSWSLYLVIMAASLIDWDTVIARNNLSHPLKDNMETSFLLTLSDKVLPDIDRHSYILQQSTSLNTYTRFRHSYEEEFQSRVQGLIARKESASWLSWNYKDWKAFEYFKLKQLTETMETKD